MPIAVPPSIRTDESNAFAHHTMAERLPGILRDLADSGDFSPAVRSDMHMLADELANDAPIRMLKMPAPDYDQWRVLPNWYRGDTWLNSEWFFAETFFFRRVIEATRWWEGMPDPFRMVKAEEIRGTRMRDQLEAALASPDIETLLGFALWGNRADLSHPAASLAGDEIADSDLIVDDREAAVSRLLNAEGPVHIIADNAGTELGGDLLLTHWLLGQDIPVVMHLKMHPTYISDATTTDVWWTLDEAKAGRYGPDVADAAEALRAAILEGRFMLAPDLFWNSSRFLSNLPPRLVAPMRRARLVILKGDANYRRALNDAIYPADTPFSDVVAGFPAPLLALRTLKSDPVVGLRPGLAEELSQQSQNWRVNGQRGMIQFYKGSLD